MMVSWRQRRREIGTKLRLCRELEAAYETIVEIWRRGESPRSFSVSPL